MLTLLLVAELFIAPPSFPYTGQTDLPPFGWCMAVPIGMFCTHNESRYCYRARPVQQPGPHETLIQIGPLVVGQELRRTACGRFTHQKQNRKNRRGGIRFVVPQLSED